MAFNLSEAEAGKTSSGFKAGSFARLVRVAALCLVLSACDPFDIHYADYTVADGNGATVELLTPGRRLPRSATGIHIRTGGFQDIHMDVRFGAPIRDALAFEQAMLGTDAKSCDGGFIRSDATWWPKGRPIGYTCREDMVIHPDSRLPIQVEVLPHGPFATVLVSTSTF